MLWSFSTGPAESLYNKIISFNTLRPRQNRRHFADDTFKHIFLNENVRISIKISLKFVPKGPFHNNSALVQIMAWRRPGDKPLSEPMMVRSLTHICVTRPRWWSVFPSSYSDLNPTLIIFTLYVIPPCLRNFYCTYNTDPTALPRGQH